MVLIVEERGRRIWKRRSNDAALSADLACFGCEIPPSLEGAGNVLFCFVLFCFNLELNICLLFRLSLG